MIANRDGVGNVLEPEAVALQRVQPEEIRLAAGSEDQIVVCDRAGTRLEPARREIHAGHVEQAKIEVLLTAQNGACRFRDLLGFEARGRDLIEQRLEEVVVVAIDEHDLYRRATQRPGGIQPSESRADDDDGRGGRHSFARLANSHIPIIVFCVIGYPSSRACSTIWPRVCASWSI